MHAHGAGDDAVELPKHLDEAGADNDGVAIALEEALGVGSTCRGQAHSARRG